MGDGVSALRHRSDELALAISAQDRDFPIRNDRGVFFEMRPGAGPRPESRYEEYLGMTAVIASQPMRRLIAAAARVGRSGSAVLITGESGTGKELIARAVHHHSARAANAFVHVNCAAMPRDLMETLCGSGNLRPGFFEAAHGGTLFLDEIGELDSLVQAKLLPVLDGQPFFRSGDSPNMPLDVRVVAATNLDLEKAMTEGRFRRDLFHRLDTMHLHVPPLRDRIADISPLAAWFLRDSPLTLSAETIRILEACTWPGNVRELRNALIKASFSATGTRIEPRDLPPGLLAGEQQPSEEFSLQSLEEQTIRRVLERTGGHRQKAADLLGISRRTLIRRLKQYRSPDGRRTLA